MTIIWHLTTIQHRNAADCPSTIACERNVNESYSSQRHLGGTLHTKRVTTVITTNDLIQFPVDATGEASQ